MGGITSNLSKSNENDFLFGYLDDNYNLFIDDPGRGVLRFYGINKETNNPVLGVFDKYQQAHQWGDKKVRIKSIHFELEEV